MVGTKLSSVEVAGRRVSHRRHTGVGGVSDRSVRRKPTSWRKSASPRDARTWLEGHELRLLNGLWPIPSIVGRAGWGARASVAVTWRGVDGLDARGGWTSRWRRKQRTREVEEGHSIDALDESAANVDHTLSVQGGGRLRECEFEGDVELNGAGSRGPSVL
jgi:hypothetical protein